MFAQQPIKLAGGQLCSKCLDDRAGVAAILLAMEQLHAAKDKLKCNVAVLISTQEEVTELGAQTGAFTVQPEYAIAVDVTHGRTPDGPSDGVFDLGSGVAVGMGPNLHRGFTKVLIKTAKANDIDYTLEIMEGQHRHECVDDADRRPRHRNGFAVHSGKNTCIRRSRSWSCLMCRQSLT